MHLTTINITKTAHLIQHSSKSLLTEMLRKQPWNYFRIPFTIYCPQQSSEI